jgi:uncharacterized heparinase superfamily protein
MKLTHRIADWLTGGEFSAYKADASFWRETSFDWSRQCKDQREEVRAANDALSKAQARLDRIAEMETPGANATVKRMARVARGEE